MIGIRLVDARDAAHAVALLRAHGPRAQPLAAGGDLLALLKDGIRAPAPRVLVNLATASDLAQVRRGADGHWHLGAMATLAALARIEGLPALLAEAIPRIASPQLRTRTTLAGNLLQRPRCLYFRHPDETCFKKGGVGCPSTGGPLQAYGGSLFAGDCHAGHPSDLAPALMVLGARAELRGPRGVRCVPLAELYRDAAHHPTREAALEDDELLCKLMLPPSRFVQAFEKVAPRDAHEFATASAAVAGRALGARVAELRVTMGGVAPGPWSPDTRTLHGERLATLDAAACAEALLPCGLRAPFAARLPAARLALERALSRVLAALRTAAT
jgi:xanthine dehydrogenase YagS FAD-binding subunit